MDANHQQSYYDRLHGMAPVALDLLAGILAGDPPGTATQLGAIREVLDRTLGRGECEEPLKPITLSVVYE